MMIDTLTDIASEPAVAYPSLVSLRETHSKLLKLHHERETASLLDEIEAFVSRASATGALLDRDDDRWATQSLLDYWVTILYHAKRTPPDATLAESDPSLAPQLDDSLCPYRGLNAFQENDRDIFFGRRRLIESFCDYLRDRRLLAVIGPSGSGKSSLVLAGVLPELKRGVLNDSESWRYLPSMVPGSNPLRNLALASRPQDKSIAEWVPSFVQNLKQDPHGLLTMLGDKPSVIVVDQFEEIFTLCTQDELRKAFIENLISIVKAPSDKHVVILTLRTDYETQIVSVPKLMPLFEKGQARVTPLTSTDLYEAIEEPAKRIGLKFEDSVVDALVKDILGEAAGLPLLQFALLRLWRMREHNLITWRAYKSLGGARRALALTADEFYNGLLKEDQETAKHILLRLARPTEGLEVTSNRVRRKTLYLAGRPDLLPTARSVANDRIDRVLEKLVGAGLIRLTRGEILADDQVEVAHEALVRNWPTLMGWLEDERVRLRKRLRLTAIAEQWRDLGKDPAALWSGSLLAEALDYKDLNDLEGEFVVESQNKVAAEEREKENARQRELELERAKVEWIMRYAKRSRRFAVLFAVVGMLAVIFGLYALKKRKQAEANGQRAVANAEEVNRVNLKIAFEERQRLDEIANLAKVHEYQLQALVEELKTKGDQLKEQIRITLRAKEQERTSRKKAENLSGDLYAIYALTSQAMEYQSEATDFQGKNKFPEALDRYKRLYRYYRIIDDPQGQQAVLSQMANIYNKQGRPAEEQITRNLIDQLPKPIKDILFSIVQQKGIAAAVSEYRDMKRSHSDKYDFREDQLNKLGYDLLRSKKVDEAIAIFKLNVEAYPAGYNTYDSLGEAYMIAGNKGAAIFNYEKSLKLNRNNTNAIEMLKKLRGSN
jgi:tetratricopeptide (TPR) repeat protein/energy-coupling factor transporter ATP-binding protein EcfA2